MTDFYPQGKTSINSRFNILGSTGWTTMEVPGFLIVLYLMFTLPSNPLPWQNWLMAGMFTFHYLYRALLAPLVLNPSMSPIHPLVWFSAFSFQVMNGLSIGGWLAGYGPISVADWSGRSSWMIGLGVVVWALGLFGNFYHDDELREIRRKAMREQQRKTKEKGEGKGKVDKVYMMPQNGLFKYILYPHYVCEWIEWIGFWMVGGWNCIPARSFATNEVSTMTPRALQGRTWYVKRFGEKEVGGRTALIPGVI